MGIPKISSARFSRLLIVFAGIIFGQAVLYGPSLIGEKILLPLDTLAQPSIYIPRTPETAKIVPHDKVLTDLVYQFEPARRFAVSEIHQGRFPLWAPYHFGGVPFIWPKYSLFYLLEYCTPSPVILAWAQLFAALVAGIGMYCFCRQSLSVSFWPAAVCAWCYPLTAFFILWQGFPTGLAVYWLPWLFLAVDKTIRGANQRSVIILSVVTFLVLTSGLIDLAGQALLGSGIYALWCLWTLHPQGWSHPRIRTAVAQLILAWGLGFMLAAPHVLPLLEYANSGLRMMRRHAGVEERPPVGLAALPPVVLPDLYGASEKGSALISNQNVLESASAAYAGVVAALLVAPLAWCSRRHRALNLFWIGIAFFGLCWCLNVPGLVHLLRQPGLNMMSHNRLVFLTAFAILSMTAIGLETVWLGAIQRRWWFCLPAALLAALAGWCIYRSRVFPEVISTQGEFDAFYKKMWATVQITADVGQVQAWFTRHYLMMALFCGMGLLGWLLLWFRKAAGLRLFPALAICLMADLIWFDYGRATQSDPALYYPKIPVLAEVAQSVPGRVIGLHCLPASVAAMAGLADIRGYDAIDPARMVRLIKLAEGKGSRTRPYGALQFFVPKGSSFPPDGVRLSPVLDMLGVRYAINQDDPAPPYHPRFQGGGYWVLINSNALPRVFVPKSIEIVTSDEELLEKLGAAQFNPAAVAYVQTSVALPGNCVGQAQITSETPSHIVASVQMQTPGLIVLADRWDPGWRASWNGQPVNILQVNYALRGVVIPSGSGTLEFTYRPGSLILGLWMAGFAVVVLAGLATQCHRSKTTARNRA
ncbi:MAG: YfhO family protein [Limisphaerales bacterium]